MEGEEGLQKERAPIFSRLPFPCMQGRSGRAFVRRLINLSKTATHLDHFIRLNTEARSDIEWWHKFASSWNGTSMMTAVMKTTPEAMITSNASGTWGCGAFSGKAWFQLKWVEQLVAHNYSGIDPHRDSHSLTGS